MAIRYCLLRMRNQFLVAVLAAFCAFQSAAAQTKAPAASDTAAVTVRRNIDYLGNGREERADLYLPKDEPGTGKTFPAVLIIHGGGWTGANVTRLVKSTSAPHSHSRVTWL